MSANAVRPEPVIDLADFTLDDLATLDDNALGKAVRAAVGGKQRVLLGAFQSVVDN